MATPRTLDDLLGAVAADAVLPVYLVEGDLVAAEPQAARLAEALAAKVGCPVRRYRRPPGLGTILADLRTYSLFDAAKVVLVVDSAIFADEKTAADLVDQAAEVLPLAEGRDADSDPAVREAASRLLQALHVFGVDPAAGPPAEVFEKLPKWAFQGGAAARQGRSGGRTAKQAKALRDDLAALLTAALGAGLKGFAEGDLAELGEIVASGLPPGHSLVLVEHAVAKEHPVRRRLERQGAVVVLAKVAAGRQRGDWQGLELVLAELERETGAAAEPAAVAELARRTLRQTGAFGSREVDAGSTSRFGAEYRKLASQAAGGRITRQMVEQSVDDRGDQDVWQILDALGQGRGGDALAQLRRYLAAADDVLSARLVFFGTLARYCHQLVAVAGAVQLFDVPRGETYYKRFEQRWAPVLQGELPNGDANPLAGIKAFPLFRAYQTASRVPPEALARLPWWVLETELRIKGDASDADAALTELMARLVGLVRGTHVRDAARAGVAGLRSPGPAGRPAPWAGRSG